MLPPELTDAVIVLLRQDDRILLGNDFSLPADAVSGYYPDQLFRIIDFNVDTRVLYLKPDGRAPESAFRISFSRYGDLLEALDIERIVIRQSRQLIFTEPIAAYRPPPVPQPQYQPHPQPQPTPPPRITRFTETQTFDIRDAIFDDGTIMFTVKVRGQNVKATVQNPAVRKYFDSVKNYIWKIFGSKKTSCTITFDTQNEKYVPVSVDSCVLLHLDESILQNIHDGWVDQEILANDSEVILILEDLIGPVKDDTLNTETVFNHLVKEPKTKHYHHLRYLSARQAIDLQKLAITGKPLSFVFVIRENNQMFLIWETYLTQEATYIWKLSSAPEVLKKYSLIQELRKAKRMIYRRKKEDDFFFIEHNYQESMNGFHKWKEALENIIL